MIIKRSKDVEVSRFRNKNCERNLGAKKKRKYKKKVIAFH